MTLSSQSVDRWGCVPVLVVVCPELSCSGAHRLLGRVRF